MTRRYKSFRSEVANLPPSNCTMGRISGGITGITSRIIHSGRLPERRNASTTSSLLMIFSFFCPVALFSSAFICRDNSSRFNALNSFLTASAPMSASKSSSNRSRARRYSLSLRTWFMQRSVEPGLVTIYWAKYNTFSSSLGEISSKSPMREGIARKYHM